MKKKTRHISFNVTEADYQKIEALKRGKTTTQFLTDLLQQSSEKEKEEGANFLALIEGISQRLDEISHSGKIDTLKITQQLTEISQNLETISRKLETQQKGGGDPNLLSRIESHFRVVETVLAVMAWRGPAVKADMEKIPTIWQHLEALLPKR